MLRNTPLSLRLPQHRPAGLHPSDALHPPLRCGLRTSDGFMPYLRKIILPSVIISRTERHKSGGTLPASLKNEPSKNERQNETENKDRKSEH